MLPAAGPDLSAFTSLVGSAGAGASAAAAAGGPALSRASSGATGLTGSFAGLSNQGATCYMNSLLQSYFMTPEFRDLMFRWRYRQAVDGDHTLCVPLQLQKLLARLQTTDQRSISTESLTKSFGWSRADAFQQHDVQELAHVLLDALDKTVKASGGKPADAGTAAGGDDAGAAAEPTGETGTEAAAASGGDAAAAPAASGAGGDDSTAAAAAGSGEAAPPLTVPSSLFEGELDDYVRCAECGNHRSSKAVFHDLALDVRPFGADKAFASVGEALASFVTPETMDGGNKVGCDVCDKRTRSVKGLRVSRWPQILVLQLKRFTIDMTSPTLARVKLQDRIAFPFALDAETLIAEAEAGRVSEAARIGDAEPEDAAVGDAEPGAEGATGDDAADSPMGGTAALDSAMAESLEGLASGPAAAPASASAPKRAPPPPPRNHRVTPPAPPGQYELYAVLVHSGGASGGHYYAYLKDLESCRWWNFNDSYVSQIDEATVRLAFGGGGKSYGASAYMLMYRRVARGEGPVPTPPAVAGGADAAKAVVDAAGSPARLVPSRRLFPGTELLPEALREHIVALERQHAAEEEAKRADARLISLTVLGDDEEGAECSLRLDREDATIGEVARRALVELKLAPAADDTGAGGEEAGGAAAAAGGFLYLGGGEGGTADPTTTWGMWRGVDLRLWRLRRWDNFTKLAREPLPNNSATLAASSLFNGSRLVLERRESPDVPWPAYSISDVAIRFVPLGAESGAPLPARRLAFSRLRSLGSLRAAISERTSIPAASLRLVRADKTHNGVRAYELVGDRWPVTRMGLASGGTVYAEDLRSGPVRAAIAAAGGAGAEEDVDGGDGQGPEDGGDDGGASASSTALPTAHGTLKPLQPRATGTAGRPKNALDGKPVRRTATPSPAPKPVQLGKPGPGGQGGDDPDADDTGATGVMPQTCGSIPVLVEASLGARHFADEASKVKVRYNSTLGGQWPTADASVTLRSDAKTGELKRLIAKALGRALGGLTFRRVSATGAVLRAADDGTKTLAQTYILDNSAVIVIEGPESTADAKDVPFVLWRPAMRLGAAWLPSPRLMTADECTAEADTMLDDGAVRRSDLVDGWMPTTPTLEEVAAAKDEGPRLVRRAAAIQRNALRTSAPSESSKPADPSASAEAAAAGDAAAGDASHAAAGDASHAAAGDASDAAAGDASHAAAGDASDPAAGDASDAAAGDASDAAAGAEHPAREQDAAITAAAEESDGTATAAAGGSVEADLAAEADEWGPLGEPSLTDDEPAAASAPTLELGTISTSPGSVVGDLLDTAGERLRALGALSPALQAAVERLRARQAAAEGGAGTAASEPAGAGPSAGPATDGAGDAASTAPPVPPAWTDASADAPARQEVGEGWAREHLCLMTTQSVMQRQMGNHVFDDPRAELRRYTPYVSSATALYVVERRPADFPLPPRGGADATDHKQVVMVWMRFVDTTRHCIGPNRMVAVRADSPPLELGLRLAAAMGVPVQHLRYATSGVYTGLHNAGAAYWSPFVGAYGTRSTWAHGARLIVSVAPTHPRWPERKLPLGMLRRFDPYAQPSVASVAASTAASARPRPATYRRQERGIHIATHADRPQEAEGPEPGGAAVDEATAEDVYGFDTAGTGAYRQSGAAARGVTAGDAHAERVAMDKGKEAATRARLQEEQAAKDAEVGEEDAGDAFILSDEDGQADVFAMLGAGAAMQ